MISNQLGALLLPLLLLLVERLPHVTSFNGDPDNIVTIQELPAWSLQRSCGIGCIRNTYNGDPDICKDLGCCNNGCYCATENHAAATSIVKSCWSAFCGTDSPNTLSNDIYTALSIYDSYCGIIVDVVTTTIVGAPSRFTRLTVVTASLTTNAVSGIVETKSFNAPTETTTPGGPTQGSGGYSTSDKIALGVGLGVGIPTLIATVWMCIRG